MPGEYALIAWLPAAIANGESLSAAVDIRGHRLVAIRQPASCEGTTFSLQASYDGGNTYEDVQTPSAEWQVTKSGTAAQFIYLDDTKAVVGPTHLKIRSGLSGAATNQTGAVTVYLGLYELRGA